MALVDDIDSGMDSQEGSQKEFTPEKASQNSKEFTPEKASQNSKEFSPEKKPELEMDYEEEPDETLGERIWGLTEMFPEPLRNATGSVVESTQKGIKSLYTFSRGVFWVVFSTSIILFAPVIFEVERAQMEEMQRSQQKQMLLGPNTAVSGGAGGLTVMPPLQR